MARSEETVGTDEPAARPRRAGIGSRVPRPGGRARAVGLFTTGVLAAFLAVTAYGLVNPPRAPLTQQDVTGTVNHVLASQTPGPALSEQAYAAIAPSLVVVEASAPTPSASGAGTLGSGVVVDSSGDILTALHVVSGATAIELTFADGTRSPAAVVERQPTSDIAVLQAARPPAPLVPATLGNPRGLRVGTDVYVVGDPFGLAGSITAGVVSGLDRSFQLPNGGPTLTGLIQVDAAVNPGDSGGPLVDRGGRVVGIVTALINPTREDVFIGIGLAVPIDVAGGAAGLPQD